MNKFSKRSLGLMLCVGLISTAGVNAVAQPATVQHQNNAQDQQANQAPSTLTSGKGIAAANLPKDAETSVTLETGTANFDWRRSFRMSVRKTKHVLVVLNLINITGHCSGQLKASRRSI